MELFGLKVSYLIPSAVWPFVKLSCIQLLCRYHVQVIFSLITCGVCLIGLDSNLEENPA